MSNVLIESTWKHGTALWTSSIISPIGVPVHSYNCEFLQLANDKADSEIVIMRHVDEETGIPKFVATSFDRLSKVYMTQEEGVAKRAAWATDVMQDIGSVGKSVIVGLLSSRFLEIVKVFKLRQREYVQWPDDTSFIKFTQKVVTKDMLILAGIKAKVMIDLLARGVCEVATAEEFQSN